MKVTYLSGTAVRSCTAVQTVISFLSDVDFFWYLPAIRSHGYYLPNYSYQETNIAAVLNSAVL
jgi:hypothetical protein